MLGALGAVTSTLPADALLAEIGWRKIFELSAALAACCAVMIYFAVAEASAASVASGASPLGLGRPRPGLRMSRRSTGQP